MSDLDPAKAFLGVGWAFPPQPDEQGEMATVAYEEDIRQAIRIILETRPGERVMRPEFGAGLHALVFEPMSQRTLSLVRHRVQEALVLWEPRIDQVTVQARLEAPHGRLLLDIRYRVRLTNLFYNLVYPFYLTEGEGR
jgi:phage baseplate assembly protein W